MLQFIRRCAAMKTSAISSASRSVSQRASGQCLLSHIWLAFLLSLGMNSPPAVAQNTVVLVGSGSSVPAPLYARWTQEYSKHNTHVQMRYLPVGTSEGIRQISRGVGDFGAGEAQLTDKERKEDGLTELPVVLIGIVPIYNLPDVHGELRLSGEVLAEIFLGDIKNWNAGQLAKLNPDLTLPNLPIEVVNRPAGKGSNFVFTDFLSKVSSKFRAEVGTSASPKWPVGVPAERSSDMADKVKASPGSIGYVEYQYAVKGNLSQAAVLNPAGKFVRASLESIAASCTAVEEPRWNGFSASLTNAGGANSFPIASFTWIYLRTKSTDSARAAALSDLLNWIYSDGQQFAGQEGYSELPPQLLSAVRKKVKELQ
jgi:phosphate transport system substrate-binding protein